MNDSPPSKIDARALRAEQARLGRFFESIAKHRKALDLAIEENFGGTPAFSCCSAMSQVGVVSRP